MEWAEGIEQDPMRLVHLIGAITGGQFYITQGAAFVWGATTITEFFLEDAPLTLPNAFGDDGEDGEEDDYPKEEGYP